MWASGARLEGTCGSNVLSMDWKEAGDGSGGWLATGCSSGTDGISWISHKKESTEGGGELQDHDTVRENTAPGNEGSLYKSHFILRGHIGEVQIVRWMPNGDRLASYDSWGRIIIWGNRANVLAYEFQINTAVLVTDMQWSPCGFYLVACGKGGHIMSFSGVTGMNLFSVQIEATSCHANKAKLTCCTWNKPGTRVAFGTSNGEVIVLDPADNGNSITTITIHQGIPVQSLSWYGPVVRCTKQNGTSYLSQSLSVYLRKGDCILFRSVSCKECVYSKTGVMDGRASWNSDDSLLVVIGYKKEGRGSAPIARFLNQKGYVVFAVTEDLPILPRAQFPVKNVLWGLRDSIVILSYGAQVYTLKVNQSLPTLENLCRQTIMSKVIGEGDDASVEMLPLPNKEISRLAKMKEPLMPNHFDTSRPDIINCLHEPVQHNHRLHCVMEAIDGGYIIKLEHLNCFMPLLQAKRKTRKRGSVQCTYVIEPAFECSHSQLGQDDDDWAESVSSSSLGTEVPSSRRRPQTSFLRQLWATFNSVHSQGVMDIAQGELVAASTGGDNTERLVLAEVEGNSFTNRFRFHTSSPLFQDGFLGSVNICTNYIKCKPRKLSVVLPMANDVSSAADENILYSKDPEWNEEYQIYELDFGGRVNRDSIKNFQIDCEGQVVLQFGKSDTKRFCLDIQAPFSLVQATCVALACLV